MPKKLSSQVILLILIVLFGAQLLISITFILIKSENDVILNRLDSGHYVHKMGTAVKIFEYTKSRMNLYTFSTYRINFTITDDALFDVENQTENDKSRTQRLAQALGDQYPNISVRQVSRPDNLFYSAVNNLKYQFSGAPRSERMQDPRSIVLQSQVQLMDGQWVGMTVYDIVPVPAWISSTIIPMVIFSLFFTVLSVFIVKRITSPLAELASKANKLGKGHSISAIEPRGPIDIQDAIVAFNAMRKRLLSVKDHRARALAAISHDIRTPLTSMRLQAEFITEADIQEKILEQIEEMEQICEATVTFALKDSWSEESRYFDISSLVESLCCDLEDQGLGVQFEWSKKIPFLGRPVAIKRALNNLIKNGVKYGVRVNVYIEEIEDTIAIHIVDEGIGIPEEDKERLFEPFERSEQSRNRSSGGLGLGMAIARSVIRSHGGEIELNNLPDKGLDVVVILPQ